MTDQEEKWLSVRGAARLSGFSSAYLRRLLRGGKVKARKFSELVWQVDRESLMEYLREGNQANDRRRGPKF